MENWWRVGEELMGVGGVLVGSWWVVDGELVQKIVGS